MRFAPTNVVLYCCRMSYSIGICRCLRTTMVNALSLLGRVWYSINLSYLRQNVVCSKWECRRFIKVVCVGRPFLFLFIKCIARNALPFFYNFEKLFRFLLVVAKISIYWFLSPRWALHLIVTRINVDVIKDDCFDLLILVTVPKNPACSR